MTVQQTKSRSPTYIGDGAEFQFPTDFEFLESDDVRVFVDGAEVFSFSVVGGQGSEGTVTLTNAPASGATIDILRDTARIQTLYSAALATPTIMEKTFDRVTRILQSLDRLIGQSIRSPFHEIVSFVLPDAAARAGKLLGFDVDGNVTTATVGNAQTVAPMYFTIDAAQTDYDLASPDEGGTLPLDTTVAATDLFVEIGSGYEPRAIPSAPEFEVIGGTVLRLNVSLVEMHGYIMQVRVVSYATLFESVPDGSINSPDKFADRPVDLAAMALGTPLGQLGYDAAGTPEVQTRKYIGEAWTWSGVKASLPIGNVICEGQSLAAADFPLLFAAIGYTFGGSGANFNLPDPQGRSLLFAGQGNTAEGGGLGTARLIGTDGGAETHTQTIDELAAHNHGLDKTGVGVGGGASAVTAAGPPDDILSGSSGGGSAMNNMSPWLCIGYLAVHTGQTNHDYMGVVT